MMEENGLSRNQALEQLAKQKDNRTETEILLDDSIPFYQEDVDSGNNENISGKNYYIKDGKKVELIKRPYAPEIATDNTMVNVTEIDGDPIPEFEKTADLREWILNNLAIFGDVKIEATGQIINVTKGGVRKAIKKRGKAHHQTYAKLKDVIRNAQYVGFEKNDGLIKHKNIDGQDLYYSAMVLNGTPYSVRIKVDVYNDGMIANYADHAVTEIEITPARNATEDFTPPQFPKGAIHKMSIAVLRGKVNPVKYNNSDNSLSQDGKSGHRGQYDAANRIITLFSTADPSTIIHETAHFFLDDMRRFSYNEETSNELAAIYRYVGSLDGNISREQHEYFARSFEAYLMEGKAPNQLLRRAFVKFKNWLSFIYGNIKKLDVDLDNNIRKTFDEMLGGKKLDFAMQMSSQNMLANAKSGYIPQNVINKAMALLDSGKMSKTDMNTMIEKIKNHELRRTDVIASFPN